MRPEPGNRQPFRTALTAHGSCDRDQCRRLCRPNRAVVSLRRSQPAQNSYLKTRPNSTSSLPFSTVPARPIVANNPAPLHLVAGCPLRRDVPAGTVLTVDMVAEPADSPLWQLRRRQDERFLM